jgi:hypothetical protein
MASTGLLAPGALGFNLRRRGKPSVSLSICQVAVLGDSPRQPTLSQSSQSGLWCGRQTAKQPHPRVSACYLRTRGHQLQGEATWIATPAISGNVCGLRISTRGKRNPSWGGWAVYIAGLRYWRIDRSSCWERDPAFSTIGQPSSWPNRCEATRWVAYLQ